jgi:hypothetical protein
VTADRWVRWWIGEANRQVVVWVVNLEADLKKVEYSWDLESEQWVGRRIGEVQRRFGEVIAVGAADREAEGGLGK